MPHERAPKPTSLQIHAPGLTPTGLDPVGFLVVRVRVHPSARPTSAPAPTPHNNDTPHIRLGETLLSSPTRALKIATASGPKGLWVG